MIMSSTSILSLDDLCLQTVLILLGVINGQRLSAVAPLILTSTLFLSLSLLSVSKLYLFRSSRRTESECSSSSNIDIYPLFPNCTYLVVIDGQRVNVVAPLILISTFCLSVSKLYLIRSSRRTESECSSSSDIDIYPLGIDDIVLQHNGYQRYFFYIVLIIMGAYRN